VRPQPLLFGIIARYSGQYRPEPGLYLYAKNLWWRLDRALDEESLYYSGLICSLEAIRSGCTAVIDHHASPNYIGGSLSQLRHAFLKVGLRGMTCFETTDRNGGAKELQAGVENIRFADEIDQARKAGREPYLVEAHIGAHAPFTVTDDGLSMLGSVKSHRSRSAYPCGGGQLRCFSRPPPLRQRSAGAAGGV
jgi:cytosine/adenosine deaminase-related metal-dependent hydrolase